MNFEGVFSKRKENDYFLEGEDENLLVRKIKDFSFSMISRKAALQKGFLIKKDGRRDGFDLLNPFSNQGFYCSSSKMPLPIFFPFKILLFSQLELDSAIGAANFAARLGLETLSLSLPLTFPLKRTPGREGNFIRLRRRPCLRAVTHFGVQARACPWGSISHAKRIIFKPTFFINCRHHANEVSSTNAGLKLAHLLATRPHFKQFLKKADVVINPMENVDGMMVLEEMLKLTPTDKLHAGRYNQAGQEYYIEYFNPKTPFGEARVKPAIWERWLPDICVDNHGFPSHEWEQPFSGYAPLRFREWWIPRALLFLYVPHIEEKTIMKCNHIFSERYFRYRQRWFQSFSPSKQSLQFLPLHKRFQRTNYSYRYPHITTVDFITEVADETAQGDFLKTCVSAHLQSNLAVIRLLNYLDINVKKIYLSKDRQACFIWYRERPLVFGRLRKEG